MITHLHGDCGDVLSQVQDGSAALIFTSPPYANARKGRYEGVPINKYVEWFMERAAQFKRILNSAGTFILNIKEQVVDGERSTYVMEIVQEMRRQGWLWTEEWIWYKTACCPGKMAE